MKICPYVVHDPRKVEDRIVTGGGCFCVGLGAGMGYDVLNMPPIIMIILLGGGWH